MQTLGWSSRPDANIAQKVSIVRSQSYLGLGISILVFEAKAFVGVCPECEPEIFSCYVFCLVCVGISKIQAIGISQACDTYGSNNR